MHACRSIATLFFFYLPLFCSNIKPITYLISSQLHNNLSFIKKKKLLESFSNGEWKCSKLSPQP